jgi:hypothetical protein
MNELNTKFDYEDYLNNIESDVRTRFTKLKHKAKLTEYKSADGQTITTLDWRRADGAGDHYVRYIFDRGNLYITGDLGDAVFYFWDGLTYDNATLIKHRDWRYIKSKCLTSEDIWWFDKKIALQETVCDFGRVYSGCYLSWFIGLEMAVTQLKENHTEDTAND